MKELLQNYNKHIRPVAAAMDVVTVMFGVSLRQIVAVVSI